MTIETSVGRIRTESTRNRHEGDRDAVATVPGPAVDHVPTQVDVRVRVARPDYERRFAQAVVLSDLTALIASAGLHRLWGSSSPWEQARLHLALGLVALGTASILAARAWESRVLGQGTEEFNRLFRAFLWLGVVTGLLGLGFKMAPLRPYAFGVVPVAFALAVAGRWLLRRQLHRMRAHGSCMRNVLAVGTEEAVAELIARTRRSAHNGWRITGACIPTGGNAEPGHQVNGVPVIGDLGSVLEVVRRFGYHVVAVSGAPGWSPRRLHTLAWDLEGTGTSVVVDPGLMEIAGPRLRIDTLDGVPVLRLTEPSFSGPARLVKAVSDLFGALLLLVVAMPLMIAITVAVKCDGGPILYRQRRVGRSGVTFTMLKFRTMTVGADRLIDALLEYDHGAGPMFKMADDPRVTRVGRVLRRYSLDELPQLLNVLSGSMSLVGPRPPMPAEVASYDREARRRLLVKPGMTGLWQVSGRSDLSWEESVRLDRRYVENWTLFLDALIVWKTVGAIVRGSGAY